jgi:hypothetical protein
MKGKKLIKKEIKLLEFTLKDYYKNHHLHI